jgi:signal transduction histidine kinase
MLKKYLNSVNPFNYFFVAVMVLLFVHLASRSDLERFTQDRVNDEVLFVPELKVAKEIPVSHKEISIIKSGGEISSWSLSTPHQWNHIYSGEGSRFSEQLLKALGGQYPQQLVGERKNLKGLPLAIFFDLPTSEVKKLANPHLYFYGVSGDWELYAGHELISAGARMDRNIAVFIPPKVLRDGVLRFTWVVKNGSRGRLGGVNFLYGVTVRSGKETDWARLMLPLQRQWPIYAVIATFASLCFFAVLLALMFPKYSDLWALAAFCATLFFVMWTETPFYWMGFDFGGGEGDLFRFYKTMAQTGVVVTGAAMSIGFFRLKGKLQFFLLVLVGVWATALIASTVPGASSKITEVIRRQIATQVVWGLLGSQMFIFVIGLYSFSKHFLFIRRSGLDEEREQVTNRAWQLTAYSLGMAFMVAVYTIYWPHYSVNPGTEYFLLSATIPPLLFLALFYVSLGRQYHQIQREAAVARVTQMLAHDVRKPFSMLKLILSELQEKQPNQDTKSMMHLVDKEIASVENLVQDVMELGRDRSLRTESVSITHAVHDVVQSMARLNPDARIQFIYQWGHIHCVNAHRVRLLRVFSNIATNALSAMDKEGTVTWRSKEVDGWIEVEVANNGPQICEDNPNRVFSAFYTKRKGGTGLGLAIVHRIISDFGGEVSCRSSETETVFSMKIPATNVKEEQDQLLPDSLKKAIKPQPVQLDRILNVVLVEDNLFYRAFWERVYRKHQIAIYSNPNDFFVAYEKGFSEVDCVITDYYFGEESDVTGDDVIDFVRNLKGPPVLLCSNSSLESFEDRNVTMIEKEPPTPERLMQLLRD